MVASNLMENMDVSLNLVLKKRGPSRAFNSGPKVSGESSRPPLTEEQTTQLLTAAPADCLSVDPCPICGSQERWHWLDGRALCRVCLILDLAPLTLRRWDI
jgi:hypothetical protein